MSQTINANLLLISDPISIALALLNPYLGNAPRPPLSTYDPYDPNRARQALLDHLYQILEAIE